MIPELIRKSRSYRRFIEDYEVDTEALIKLINLARFCPSAANLQPLRYIVCNRRDYNEMIFPCTKWAGYLKDWKGPEEGERPSAYIFILGDLDHSKHHQIDAGIAAQTIMLATTEMGLGGCMLAAIDREKLRELLDVSKQYEILLALALGKPKEKVVVDNVNAKVGVKYWRDDKGVHHVPKRRLDDLIYKCLVEG